MTTLTTQDEGEKMRFNPPPNWPIARGFTPPPGWSPDPSWSEPPAGWQLWLGDDPSPSSGRRGGRALILGVGAAVVLIAVASIASMVLGPIRSPAASATEATKPINPIGPRQQITLPFGLDDPTSFYPQGIAVDGTGKVYVTSVNGGVWVLAPGASGSQRVPFSSIDFGLSGAADDAGNVYVTDDGDNRLGRVQKITPEGTQTELPFTGLAQDPNLAVAADGTVYVADGGNNRVLRLAPDAPTPEVLPFVGLADPRFVSVDGAGDVVVSDRNNSRVVQLPKGSTSQVVLGFDPGLKANGVAIDDSGNVYAATSGGVAVLLKQTGRVGVMPIAGMAPFNVAVDKKGNVYAVSEDAHLAVEMKLAGQ
jgi:sugar lactone lactonase YvrE